MARKSKNIKMQSIEEVADIETTQEDAVETPVEETVEDTTQEVEAKQEPQLSELIKEEPKEVLTFENLDNYNDKALRDKMLDLLDATNKVNFLVDDNNCFITKERARIYFSSKTLKANTLSEARNIILDCLAKVGHDELATVAADTDIKYRYYDDNTNPVVTISRSLYMITAEKDTITIVFQYVIEADFEVADMVKAICRELSQRKLNKDVVSVEYTKDIGIAILKDKYLGISEAIHELDNLYR